MIDDLSRKPEPKIVVLGGGTGSFNVLSALKHESRQISAVVNMVDDGGSSGKLRDELGALPPGDVRQCLVALSDAPVFLRELFNFRFSAGELAGHSFGNLFISALESMSGSFAESIERTADVLRVSGRVIPVTLENTILEMDIKGEHIVGQANIEMAKFSGSDRPLMMLSPDAAVNPLAEEAIIEADIVIVAPGNLYSSLVPVLLTNGVAEAISNTKAEVLMIANLVNKKYQTNGYKLSDYVEVIGDYLGGPQHIDSLIYNNNPIPKQLLDKYAAGGEVAVEIDEAEVARLGISTFGAPLVSSEPVKRSKGDSLMETPRNFIRHDTKALAEAIFAATSWRR